MRVRSCLAVVLALVVSALSAATVWAGSGSGGTREYLLRTLPGHETAILQKYGLQVLQADSSGLRIYRVQFFDPNVGDTLEGVVEADPLVEFFEKNDPLELPESTSGVSIPQSTSGIQQALSTNVSLTSFFGARVWNRYASQPAGALIHLPEAHQVTTGGGIVAVIDTGVDPTHALFQGVLVEGYDFTRDVPGVPSELADLTQSTSAILEQSTSAILESDKVLPVNAFTAAILEQSTSAILETAIANGQASIPKAFGHGTMVAGLVHLVAPSARIMPLKAFRGDGTTTMYDLVRAVFYAVEHGARVINMSFTLTVPSKSLRKALDYAEHEGVVSIAAVGNAGQQLTVYPATWSDVIGIASTSDTDQRSTFSNYGSSVKLAAPGEALVTAWPAQRFAAAWGTSFSSAVVSGAAALLLRPTAVAGTDRSGDVHSVAHALSRAQNVGSGLGDGRLDLLEALRQKYRDDFGLDQLGAGLGGGADDPDHDGRSNDDEFLAGTNPLGVPVRYLAEGAASAFFSTQLAIFNPTQTATHVLLRHLEDDGTTVRHVMPVPPLGRVTVDVGQDVPALSSAAFSTVVEADASVVVDRTMSWDRSGYGSSAETGIGAPATTWYLAEGATHSGFDLFYLLQNPGATTARVTVEYLLPAPAAPLVLTYDVKPFSRYTIWVDQVPGLDNTDVSATITAPTPILVERAMYKTLGSQVFGVGHAAAAVTAPATEWFLAEGATGGLFDMFVLLANPNASDAIVDMIYLLPNGSTVTKRRTVQRQSRLTVWVDLEDTTLANTAVSVRLQSANGVSFVVERSMWWPGPTPTSWQEAHASAGVTTTGTLWALAEGEVGGRHSTHTYILVANTSAQPGSAQVTLHFEDGTASPPLTVPLPPNGRTTVDVGTMIPSSQNRRFGALVESLGASPVGIVVERAMYSDALGVSMAAGTDAVATKIR